MPNSTQHDDNEVPEEWQPVQDAATIIEELCSDLADEAQRLPQEPALGSVRESDYKVDEIAVLLSMCARDYMRFALDHAIGATRCVKHPTTSHAAYACARVALETCSTLHWLMESGDQSDSKGRFARLLELDLRDLWNQRTADLQVLEHIGQSEQQVKEASETLIEGRRAIANLLQIEFTRIDPNSRPTTAKLPNGTDRAKRFLGYGDLDYRIFSRIMHCDTPVLAATWMSVPNIEDPSETIYAPHNALSLMTDLAVCIAGAASVFFNYCGLERDDLERRFKALIDDFVIIRTTWTSKKAT